MHPLLRPTNVVIAVLGAAVVGLGTVVVVDHTTTPAPRTQTASLSAAPSTVSSLLSSGGIRRIGAGSRTEASHVFDFFTTDTKLTWQQVGADVLRGETLGQIAGTHAAKVEADALAEVQGRARAGRRQGRDHPGRGDPPGQRRSDAISVLMAAKLSALLPSGH